MPKKRIRTYAWEIPVRLTHWVNFICIVTLIATGFYIGKPYVQAVSSRQYIMGWFRFVHFTAAYLFLMSLVIRIYWAFTGNRYASWRVWLLLTKRQWKDFRGALKFYLFLSKHPPNAVGHTAIAGFTYFFVFLLFGWQILSGFALYSLSHTGMLWFYLGGWLTEMVHMQTIRYYHHLATYVIISFSMAHVYIAWYLTLKERNGLMGSIFDGYKFVTGKEWE